MLAQRSSTSTSKTAVVQERTGQAPSASGDANSFKTSTLQLLEVFKGPSPSLVQNSTRTSEKGNGQTARRSSTTLIENAAAQEKTGQSVKRHTISLSDRLALSVPMNGTENKTSRAPANANTSKNPAPGLPQKSSVLSANSDSRIAGRSSSNPIQRGTSGSTDIQERIKQIMFETTPLAGENQLGARSSSLPRKLWETPSIVASKGVGDGKGATQSSQQFMSTSSKDDDNKAFTFNSQRTAPSERKTSPSASSLTQRLFPSSSNVNSSSIQGVPQNSSSPAQTSAGQPAGRNGLSPSLPRSSTLVAESNPTKPASSLTQILATGAARDSNVSASMTPKTPSPRRDRRAKSAEPQRDRASGNNKQLTQSSKQVSSVVTPAKQTQSTGVASPFKQRLANWVGTMDEVIKQASASDKCTTQSVAASKDVGDLRDQKNLTPSAFTDVKVGNSKAQTGATPRTSAAPSKVVNNKSPNFTERLTKSALPSEAAQTNKSATSSLGTRSFSAAGKKDGQLVVPTSAKRPEVQSVFSPKRARSASPEVRGASQVVESEIPASNGMQRKVSPRLTTITPVANFDYIQTEKMDSRSTSQHHVFNWLNWAPVPFSACYNALHANFPGALPGTAVHHRITNILEGKHGFSVANTLLGASICPDEINNEVGGLADLMKSYWGGIFPLGGISGAPFVGETGFGAFSHHVPDNGDIIILFGPHVAISMDGEVGKYLRQGQHQNSTACGAVIGAYNALSSSDSKGKANEEWNECDMQMEWIKAQMEPHVERIRAQSSPMGALAYQAFAMVKEKMEKIINLEFGGGRLALIGGIQINMPGSFRDHFLPLMFEVRQKGMPPQDLTNAFQCVFTQKEVFANPSSPVCRPECRSEVPMAAVKRSSVFKPMEGLKLANMDRSAQEAQDKINIDQHTVFAWLTWGPEPGTTCFKRLHKEFPGALPGAGVHCRVRAVLTKKYGFTPENTLFGNSFCPDEINFAPAGISRLMVEYWGEVFPLGGLGGAPFAGKTGFKAFSHHVPDDGNILVIYGPHVGITERGEVGKYLREGQRAVSTACGAVIGAYNACCGMRDGQEIEFDDADLQMGWIKSQILPYCDRIQCQESPLAALAYQAFELVKSKIDKVVDTAFGKGRLALLGGILINMPAPCKDHFLPLSFEVRQAGQPIDILDGIFRIPHANERDILSTY